MKFKLLPTYLNVNIIKASDGDIIMSLLDLLPDEQSIRQVLSENQVIKFKDIIISRSLALNSCFVCGTVLVGTQYRKKIFRTDSGKKNLLSLKYINETIKTPNAIEKIIVRCRDDQIRECTVKTMTDEMIDQITNSKEMTIVANREIEDNFITVAYRDKIHKMLINIKFDDNNLYERTIYSINVMSGTELEYIHAIQMLILKLVIEHRSTESAGKSMDSEKKE